MLGAAKDPSAVLSRRSDSGLRLREGLVLNTAFATYTLLSQLGQGGSSAVWSATTPDAEDVAVKILDPRFNRNRVQKRFRNEMHFCQTTRHENIVPLLDHGLVPLRGSRSPFYVMPLFPSTLRRLMKTDLSLQRRLLLFDQVLRGLDYAHRQGVVHRDLKPENLLISGDHAHAVIADFGIAMFDEDSRATAIVTTSHDRLANFAYAAPEQRRYGGTATAASDVFALGLILNELFTGEVPHGSGYRLIGDVAPSFAYLDPVIEDMIQNLPDRRVRTAGGIRERLQQAELNATSVAAIGVLVKRIEEARLQPVEDREPNVEIVKQDYINDSFVFWFNRHPDSAWMIALTQLSGVEHVSGYSPRDWRLVGDHAGIKVDDRVAADVARRFRGWLPRINEDARKLREAEARRRKAEAEAAALENATKERRRLEILQKFAEP